MEYTHFLEPHWHWYWVLPFLFMILMFVLATRICWRKGDWSRRGENAGRVRYGCCGPSRYHLSGRWSETPYQILDRRYASGEISKEEYQVIRRELELGRSQSAAGDEG